MALRVNVGILSDVIFVTNVAELDNAGQIEACFQRLGVPYERSVDEAGVTNFYCSASGGERVSDELDVLGEPHEWGCVTTLPEFVDTEDL